MTMTHTLRRTAALVSAVTLSAVAIAATGSPAAEALPPGGGGGGGGGGGTTVVAQLSATSYLGTVTVTSGAAPVTRLISSGSNIQLHNTVRRNGVAQAGYGRYEINWMCGWYGDDGQYSTSFVVTSTTYVWQDPETLCAGHGLFLAYLSAVAYDPVTGVTTPTLTITDYGNQYPDDRLPSFTTW